MKKFRLASKYLCDTQITQTITFRLPDNELQSGTMTGPQENSQFTALRDRLEHEDYIVTDRNLWNGDRVLKPFQFNGLSFNRGETFPCASALKIRLSVAKQLKF